MNKFGAVANKRGVLMGVVKHRGLCFLILATVLGLTVGLVMLSAAEYTETGRCYRNHSALGEDELREQTIKSLLIAWVKTSARLNEDKYRYKAFLIRKSLAPNEVIDSITTKTIANLPQEAVYLLRTERDVESIDPDFLRGDFSIVRYRSGGYVEIIPSKSLQAVDANSAKNFIVGMEKRGIGLGLSERALGYGNHVFRIDYYGFINLACCEDLYRNFPRDGEPPERHTRSNINSILKGEQPSHLGLVVSNCGDILKRFEDDSIRFKF